MNAFQVHFYGSNNSDQFWLVGIGNKCNCDEENRKIKSESQKGKIFQNRKLGIDFSEIGKSVFRNWAHFRTPENFLLNTDDTSLMIRNTTY